MVTPREAAGLAARVGVGTRTVGLFVDPADDDIAAVLDAVKLDVLQLYAPQGRIDEVRAQFGLPVWRSVPVSAAADLPGTPGADAILVEPRPPPGATRPGGNAVALDWSMLAGWQPGCPWLLAGGLRPDNVAAAIHASGAVAVDVSSGVESARGVKSPDLIRRFIRAARSRLPVREHPAAQAETDAAAPA